MYLTSSLLAQVSFIVDVCPEGREALVHLFQHWLWLVFPELHEELLKKKKKKTSNTDKEDQERKAPEQWCLNLTACQNHLENL